MSGCDYPCRTPTPSQAHCPTCHRTFGGIRGFDDHRRGGECRDPQNHGYEPVNGVWRQPMSDEQVARLRTAPPVTAEPETRG